MAIDPFVDQFIGNLKTRFNNGWPPYLFHYSDILNIPSILEKGALYPRSHCENNNLLVKDSGGKSVLGHTSDTFKDHVRLYFRPRTPPLFRKEGFCPNDNQDSEFGAHCPVPVYLLLDSREVLSSSQIRFSNGNLSGVSDIFDDKRDLSKLDFGQIYHDTYFTRDQEELKREIVNRRCSEVIIPNHLQLERVLKYIVCRSTAERETLINCLGNGLKKRYKNIVRTYSGYFFCRNQYISKVNLQSSDIDIIYNRPKSSRFKYTYFFQTESGERSYERDSLVSRWHWENPRKDYTFSVSIDGHIAYKGRFIP